MIRVYKYIFTIVIGLGGIILATPLLALLNLKISAVVVSNPQSWKVLYLFLILQSVSTLVCMIISVKIGFIVFNKITRAKEI